MRGHYTEQQPSGKMGECPSCGNWRNKQNMDNHCLNCDTFYCEYCKIDGFFCDECAEDPEVVDRMERVKAGKG